MGVVYKAEDLLLKRTVALKFLHVSDDLPHLLREAQTAGSLMHPNICAVHEVDPERGFLAMEFVEGRTLKDIMGGRPLPAEQALSHAVQIAEGLNAAHLKGITHRDIKSANIIVNGQGQAKILDFGLARVAGQTGLSGEGAAAGTLGYMAPELMRGEAVDRRTDIWAFGAVLHEMLTGRLPDPSVGVLPRGIDHVVRKALACEPRDRYQHIDDMLVDLRHAAGSAREGIPASPSRRGLLVAALALAAIAVVALTPALRQRIKGVAGGWLAAGNHTTLAILPFSGGDDAEMSALAVGLAQRLGARLTRLETLRDSLTVLAPSELLARRIPDGEQAIRKLGATIVISGTLNRAGAGQRLVLEIRDRRRAQADSVAVEVAAGDVGLLEDRTAEEVVRVLEMQSDTQVSAALWRTGTSVAAAYERYVRGLGYLQRWDKAQNLDSARAEFTQAASLDPHFALARAGLAETARLTYTIHKEPSELQAALGHAQLAIRLDPRLAEPHIVQGRIYQLMAHRRDLAVVEFQRAMELEPRNGSAIQGLAASYEELGRDSEAEAAFKRGVALRPGAWSAHNTLASFYLRKNKFAAAEAQYRKALDVAPDNATVYSNLGVTLRRQGQMDEAAKMLRRSVQLEPSYQALNNLASLYYAQRNFGESARIYGQALELNGNDFIVWGSRGQALLHGGAPREEVGSSLRRAIALGEQQLQMRPDHAETLGLLALYHALLGEREAALARVNQAMTKSSVTGAAAEYCAMAYELSGDRTNAVRWARKALDTGYAWKDLTTDVEMDQLVRSSALQKAQ
jgi:tetratricopeptide (TPR) repeat protein